MTEPPSAAREPGGDPAQDPQAPTPPGFIPPQPGPPPPGFPPPGFPPQQPPGYGPGGTPQGGFPPGGFPPGGYPQGGYPPPGYSGPPAPPPAGYPTADDKNWALIAHFGGAAGMLISGFLGWVAPLIALTTRGNQSPTVRAHAVAALNFQLTWTIIAALGYITLCLFPGRIILAIAWGVGVIIGIIGGVRANEGKLYHYPVSIPLVK
jgi:hypothetical protein